MLLKNTIKIWRAFYFSFLLLLVSCTIGRQGVYLQEMEKKPILKLSGNRLKIQAANSMKNSALLICKINFSVEQNKKEIYLSADQAVGKEYQETFIIEFSENTIVDPVSYSFYWIDPDKKITKLEVEVDK